MKFCSTGLDSGDDRLCSYYNIFHAVGFIIYIFLTLFFSQSSVYYVFRFPHRSRTHARRTHRIIISRPWWFNMRAFLIATTVYISVNHDFHRRGCAPYIFIKTILPQFAISLCTFYTNILCTYMYYICDYCLLYIRCL